MTKLEEKPPLGWYTPCGHEEFWDLTGTYGFIRNENVPPLGPEAQDGSFSWLPALPSGDCPLEFEKGEGDLGTKLEKLEREANELKFSLPESFLKFMSSPEIHTRVPTNTACYLDLSSRLIDVDTQSGVKLLRFMNDQQCVLLWYLYLEPDHPVRVAFAAPEWHDEETGDTLDDVLTPTQLTICANSFEEFVYRFWIENSIWFALIEGREQTDSQRAYCDAAANQPA